MGLCTSSKSSNSQIFYSPNHPHKFVQEICDDGWRCDGGEIFGQCKLGLDDYGKSYGKSRYHCTVCEDYDLCHECLTAPKLVNSANVMSPTEESMRTKYHPHAFVRENCDDGWRCDGGEIFGKCKLGLDEYGKSQGKLRYRCTVCEDFDICHACLTSP